MKTSYYADVSDQLLESTCIYYAPNTMDSHTPLVLEPGYASRVVKHGTFLIEDVIKSKKPIFEVQLHQRTGKATIGHSDIGKKLLSFIAKDIQNLPFHFGQALVHPYIPLALWLAFRCEGELRYWHHRYGDVTLITQAVRRLNRRAEVVRRVSRLRPFRTLINRHTRRTRENFGSVANLIAKTLEACSKCLVIRVDLLTKMHFWTPEGEETVSTAIKKFICNLSKKRVIPGVLSYVLKREHGIEGGRHYHLLVLLNGHDHSADINLAKTIGEYWVKCITPEFGSYYNCQPHPDRHKRLGIGLIHVTDTARLYELRKVVTYLTKTDFFICHNSKAGTRNLWTSQAPKRKSNAGAKRACPQATWNMRFILTESPSKAASRLSNAN
ncbi:inovirus-type Gp2 protein [Chitinimonas sp. BJYL2]|uniref:YagK/YfjJ domain-containing protein n=1 Tax=Chitinimonas sp. BJYL2 TaxID=2976696 RepID=UPI0022B3BB70|nr:inovirus-type Gp2 protein [Chitinimonas sp. BJYL2]